MLMTGKNLALASIAQKRLSDFYARNVISARYLVLCK